jgi:rhodanese-related sulfurtransferase
MASTYFFVVLAITVAYVLVKRANLISEKEAAARLKEGALVIDVRSRQEFESGHLSQAINIPLDDLDTLLRQEVKDKNQALLLHCASGIRSGMAKKRLEAAGYKNAFNLGSYDRALKILSGRHA